MASSQPPEKRSNCFLMKKHANMGSLESGCRAGENRKELFAILSEMLHVKVGRK
jgi:hypothetical protein